MAGLSGVGTIENGDMIEYHGPTGHSTGRVIDQSDPIGWFCDGNKSLLKLTVSPEGNEDEHEISGSSVIRLVEDHEE